MVPTMQNASVRGPVKIQYEADYAAEFLGARDFRALTVLLPVDFAVRSASHWPSFLVDLLPQGAARRRLERDGQLSPWELLERGASNPVGNLRVRSEVAREHPKHPGFGIGEMIQRGDTFVDYAMELGAAVAGATDTQGDAPKFWVVEDDTGMWHPDNGNMSFPLRRHALLKFPVAEAGIRATDILRHEAVYQRIAARWGLRVTAELPQFLDGALLIPRFDRRVEQGREVRLGVESLYSIAGVIDSATMALRHDQVLIALARCVSDFPTECIEYVRRDLLNIALGNRDNHGRNSAILKATNGNISLAPLYDVGPAFLDARAIARVIRWDGEVAGGGGWKQIVELIDIRFEEAGLRPPSGMFRQAIAQTMPQLNVLTQAMKECGADADVIERREGDIARLIASLQTVGA